MPALQEHCCSLPIYDLGPRLGPGANAAFLADPRTNRLAVMHERLARVTQPVFDLAIVELSYDLPPMREMMQHHVSRAGDAGLDWLHDKILQFARDS